MKTASKKEYGYILSLNTNGIVWETYVQSQGSTNQLRSSGHIDWTMVRGSLIVSTHILIVAFLKLTMLMLESRLKLLLGVLGIPRNLLIGFQERTDRNRSQVTVQSSGPTETVCITMRV